MLDILIPHFNDPEGLALSLQSIERQKWNGPLRVVIADDGSRPEDKKAVERLQEQAPFPIDVVYNAMNRGRPYTRNVLLDSIEAEYVAWLDAGDEWYPAKLQYQMDALAREEILTGPGNPLWITCNYDWKWTRSRKRPVKQDCKQDQIRGLLKGSSLRAYLWTLLGRADSFKAVGWFDERLPRLQDLDFFIRFVLHGGVLKNPNQGKQYCVYHKSDIGRDALEIRGCYQYIFNKHRVLYNKYGKSFVRMQLFDIELQAARFAKNNKEHALKRDFVAKAFRHHPLAFMYRLYSKGLKI